LEWKKLGVLYGHFVIFMTIWCILSPFGKCLVIMYALSHFGMLHKEKSGNPDDRSRPLFVGSKFPSLAIFLFWYSSVYLNPTISLSLPPGPSLNMARVTRCVCEKNGQKCSPSRFLSKLIHKFSHGKK
jgi:hypothetical protein